MFTSSKTNRKNGYTVQNMSGKNGYVAQTLSGKNGYTVQPMSGKMVTHSKPCQEKCQEKTGDPIKSL